MIDVTSLVGTVFSGLSALVIEDVEDAGDMICVRARTRDRAVPCPGCGPETARVHGYHQRTAADVPVDGRPVLLRTRIRRMRCPVLDCTVQTFREQAPGILDRYQRRTARLAGQVSATVRELAGRAGSRLLPALGIGISRHTAPGEAVDAARLSRCGLLRAGEGCVISPLAVFVPTDAKGTTRPVELGSGCRVGPFAVICGGTRIGDGARLEEHVIAGRPEQDTRSATSTPVREPAR